jgi:hypothetical protein
MPVSQYLFCLVLHNMDHQASAMFRRWTELDTTTGIVGIDGTFGQIVAVPVDMLDDVLIFTSKVL